jgi:hypothetical protein
VKVLQKNNKENRVILKSSEIKKKFIFTQKMSVYGFLFIISLKK